MEKRMDETMDAEKFLKGLIRRALLGDPEAQKECTEKGIVLICPCCKSDAELITETANFTGEPERDFHTVRCKSCFLKTGLYKTQRDALHKWNTRPAPPIGRCGECKYFNHFFNAVGHCMIHSQEKDSFGDGYRVEMLKTDFCSYFEPKED